MLKKIYRLSSVKLNNSKNISSKSFNLKMARNDVSLPRFAFVVSKKIDKRATVRNRVKRKLSLCIEQIFDRIKTGNDFVFYPKPGILNTSEKELLDEIGNIFKKERLYND